MSGTTDLAEVATVVQRLAVLLAAGVAPPSAWRHVAASTESPVAARVAAGEPLEIAVVSSSGLAQDAWRGLAAAWAVAAECGSPLAGALRDYADSLRDLGETQRVARVALAAPVATARMVMVLPGVGILLGMLLGFNTLLTLATTPVGWACALAGGALLALAGRWNRRLVAAARPTTATPGLACELLAIGMAGGGSLPRTLAVVRAALDAHGVAAEHEAEAVVGLARAAGVPAAELLRAEARQLRAAARESAQAAAAALSVRLMLPLGVCVLPAFLALGVVPLLVTVISSTMGSFG